MLRDETDKVLSSFLVELERFDELATGAVIIEAFRRSFRGVGSDSTEAPSSASKPEPPASASKPEPPASASAHAFTSRKPYQALEDSFVEWCGGVLRNWYALKYNALGAALSFPLHSDNARPMAQRVIAVLGDELQGKPTSSLYADAVFLQELARSGKSLNYKLAWEEYEREQARTHSPKQKAFVEKILDTAFANLFSVPPDASSPQSSEESGITKT